MHLHRLPKETPTKIFVKKHLFANISKTYCHVSWHPVELTERLGKVLELWSHPHPKRFFMEILWFVGSCIETNPGSTDYPRYFRINICYFVREEEHVALSTFRIFCDSFRGKRRRSWPPDVVGTGDGRSMIPSGYNKTTHSSSMGC